MWPMVNGNFESDAFVLRVQMARAETAGVAREYFRNLARTVIYKRSATSAVNSAALAVDGRRRRHS